MNFEAHHGICRRAKVHQVAKWERTDAFIKPASLGMRIEESKQIAALEPLHRSAISDVHVLNGTLDQVLSADFDGMG